MFSFFFWFSHTNRKPTLLLVPFRQEPRKKYIGAEKEGKMPNSSSSNQTNSSSSLSPGHISHHSRSNSHGYHKESSPLLSHNNSKPTNITILLVTTIAFAIFVVAELIGAVVSCWSIFFVYILRLFIISTCCLHNQASHSLSLLGDGSAMSVDVFTVSSSHSMSISAIFVVLIWYIITCSISATCMQRSKRPKMAATWLNNRS